ncbi:MAG: hypothetical protein RLZZ565_983 [Planctomycetota bacterium]
MLAFRVRRPPPSRSLRSRATSPESRGDSGEEFRRAPDRSPRRVVRANEVAWPPIARRTNSSPGLRSSSGEQCGRVHDRSRMIVFARWANSFPGLRSSPGEVPSAARRRGRSDTEGAMARQRITCSGRSPSELARPLPPRSSRALTRPLESACLADRSPHRDRSRSAHARASPRCRARGRGRVPPPRRGRSPTADAAARVPPIRRAPRR